MKTASSEHSLHVVIENNIEELEAVEKNTDMGLKSQFLRLYPHPNLAQDLSLGAMSAASSVSEMQVSNVAEESNASTASTAAAAAAVPQAGPSPAASDSQPQPGPSRAAAAAGPQHQGSSGQRSVSFTVSPKKAFMMRDQAAREATSGASALSVVGSSPAQPHCKTYLCDF